MQTIKDMAAKVTGQAERGEERAELGTQGYGQGAHPTAAGTTGTAGYSAEGITSGATTGVAQQTTTTTTTTAQPVAVGLEERAADVNVAHPGEAVVCGQEFFTKTEDRPVVKERVEYIREHRDVEKEFVVETRATGVEREVAEGVYTEHLGTKERIVSVAQPKPPCE